MSLRKSSSWGDGAHLGEHGEWPYSLDSSLKRCVSNHSRGFVGRKVDQLLLEG